MDKETKRIGIIFSKEMLDKVDDYRKDVPGIPDRTNAIRELIELGYKAYKETKAKSRE